MPIKRKKLNMSDSVLWYIVGVITTDGCLSCDGRHIDITAKNCDYLEVLRKAMGISSAVSLKTSGGGHQAYRIQISNVGFYEFLLAQGLSPKKSLILKEINVPLKYFFDFCRGVIDGDGNIRKWEHPSNGNEQWVLRIYSGSKDFVAWLQDSIQNIFGVKGRIHIEKRPNVNNMHTLKYGKLAARVILEKCYYKNAIALERKARLAQECCSSRIGWTKSKTVNLGRVVESVYT